MPIPAHAPASADVPSPDPVLRVRRLGFTHPGSSPLFAGLDFELCPGVTRLDGDMGCGKTSLLRLLSGEWPTDAGSELVLRGLRPADDPAAWRREVCSIDPRDETFDELTPAGLMARLRERHPQLDEARWQAHLEGFDLGPHLAKPLYALSTGMRRKAGLAVALSAGAALTLLDEPTGGLDAASLDHLAEALCDEPFTSRSAVLMVCSRGLEDLPLAGTVRL